MPFAHKPGVFDESRLRQGRARVGRQRECLRVAKSKDLRNGSPSTECEREGLGELPERLYLQLQKMPRSK